MSNIVEKLRSLEVFLSTAGMVSPVGHQAASEIERLLVENARLREAQNATTQLMLARGTNRDYWEAIAHKLEAENARLRAAVDAQAVVRDMRVEITEGFRQISAPTPGTEDEQFFTRILACAQAGDRVTAEDVAHLRKLADWADCAPPPFWDGRLDRNETARAVAAARELIRKSHA